MAEFLTALRIEELAQDRWRLTDPLVYQTDLLNYESRVITVPTGFETDLESIPRWLPMAYALLYGSAHPAAVVHDWLYTQGYWTRKKDDDILYEAIVSSGEPKWKAWPIWLGVRLGGWVAWHHHRSHSSRP